MKRIILFFAVCLGLSVSQTTFADDADIARVASKRGTTATVTATQSTGRSVASSNAKRPDNSQNASKNARTATKPQQRVVSRTSSNQQNVKPREKAVVQSSPTKSTRVSTTSRAASSRTINSRKNESKILSFVPADSGRSTTTVSKNKHISRSGTLDNEKVTNIKSLNFSKCKTVYYECMDEFCANKDTNLRRCACSSRIHEFDGIKKQLANAEDKMLDFNQRLLTVNLDKEDAAAINTATEGELAFSKKDTSESEKLLQKITNTLNSSGDSKITNNLSAISLSLDTDTAWDGIDSIGGVATSSKSGLDLYNAARPVCIEMAREVCSDDELDIAQNGYKLTIQQDCNTVAKSYETQYNNAMEKIHESSALLDMSRLNNYQQRNSDDTLTCRKKILTQLSDASVCGENLYKCLDTTGQYIDPSTGGAFLSADLNELTNLLKEPNENEKWSKVQNNEKFVNFLNSKKEFLKPSVAQCEDIADTIWKDFLDDALAQIKLAQNSKLEEIRRSCTTLVTDCKTKALQDLSDFDARALSTFSVSADKTVNSMCSSIEESCGKIMAPTDSTQDNDWLAGMKDIAKDVSYQKIIETCTNVGRDCFVQQCNGTSGNFALCQKATDDNRRAILNRTACWNKVLECVKGADNIDNMDVTDLYQTTAKEGYYSADQNQDNKDICENNDKACYLTKQIWGNCEYAPNLYDITTNGYIVNYNTGTVLSNQILIPSTGSTLLSWFASNTGTTDSKDSCNSKGCQIDFVAENGTCQKMATNSNTTTDGVVATRTNQVINVTGDITNYCASGKIDMYGNCCTQNKNNGICIPNEFNQAAHLQNLTCTETDNYMCPVIGNLTLYCVTKSSDPRPITYYSDYAEYACDQGIWVLVDENGNYINADPDNDGLRPQMLYRKGNGTCCQYKYENGNWTWGNGCNDITTYPTSQEFLIEYVNGANQPDSCSIQNN